VVVGLFDGGMRKRLFDDPAVGASKNARRLLKVVKGKVEQNPANFDKFTEALRESNQIQLAERLERAHSELILRKSLIGTSLFRYLAKFFIHFGGPNIPGLRNANIHHT